MLFIGSFATLLIIWSVSGLLLRIAGAAKNTYYKGLNCFTLRQLSSRINTVVVSMTIICLMLFFTIVALLSAFSIRKGLKLSSSACPANFELNHREIITDISAPPVFDDVVARYKSYGYDLTEMFADYVHLHTYYDPNLSFGNIRGTGGNGLYAVEYLDIVKLSDYNALMALYGKKPLELSDNEFAVFSTYSANTIIYNATLRTDPHATIFGKNLVSKFKKTEDSLLDINAYRSNMGFLVVPDAVVDEGGANTDLFIGNYKAESDEERYELDEKCREIHDIVATKSDEDWENDPDGHGYYTRIFTKIETVDSFIGIGALLTVIGLYLGVIFLVASGAVLALRQLSDSVDSIPRYEILRKIGADESAIIRAKR